MEKNRSNIRKPSKKRSKKMSKKGSKKGSKKMSKKGSKNIKKNSKKGSKKMSKKNSKKGFKKNSKKGSKNIKKNSKKASKNIKKNSKKGSKNIKKNFNKKVIMGFGEEEYLVYVKKDCPYSEEAVNILEQKKLDHQIILGKIGDKEIEDVKNEIEEKFKIVNKRHNTWPKVFLQKGGNLVLIGGCDNLKSHLQIDNKKSEWLVFTKNGCDACEKVKKLQSKYGLDVQKISGENKLDEIKKIDERAGDAFWPKVFRLENEQYKYIGNYKDMKKYVKQNYKKKN